MLLCVEHGQQVNQGRWRNSIHRLYFVNWQRQVSFEEWDGRKVVVKRNKSTKEFHEFIIAYAYSLISLLLAHPSPPIVLREIMRNEGNAMRSKLETIGIPTPKLISISDTDLVEEYIEGGDLYASLASGNSAEIAYSAGLLTDRLHRAGYSFVDNKAQNYLVKGSSVLRTDIGFTRKSSSLYARSMDVGSFLASVMDLADFANIEMAFYNGYRSEYGHRFSAISIIIRNVLSLGFSSNIKGTLTNMALDSRQLFDS